MKRQRKRKSYTARMWGGFCGDQFLPALYRRRREAKLDYEDVRRVEVREIKRKVTR